MVAVRIDTDSICLSYSTFYLSVYYLIFTCRTAEIWRKFPLSLCVRMCIYYCLSFPSKRRISLSICSSFLFSNSTRLSIVFPALTLLALPITCTLPSSGCTGVRTISPSPVISHAADRPNCFCHSHAVRFPNSLLPQIRALTHGSLTPSLSAILFWVKPLSAKNLDNFSDFSRFVMFFFIFLKYVYSLFSLLRISWVDRTMVIPLAF